MQQQLYCKNFIVGLLGILLFNALFFTGLYIYDPLQLFHKSYFTNNVRLHTNMREQAAGIINNYDFDSVILGSSMLENTSASLVQDYFKTQQVEIGKVANLSISGSDFSIRQRVLTHLFNKKHVNTVFYSIDYLLDTAEYDLRTNYLYDGNPLNDFRAYLNQKYMNCYLRWSDSDACLGADNSLDRPVAWFDQPRFVRNFGGKDSWVNEYDYFQISRAIGHIIDTSDNLKAKTPSPRKEADEQAFREFITGSLNSGLFEFAKDYQDTKFYLIFPPYSRIQYAIWAQWDTLLFERYLQVLRYVVSASSQYPNVKVYGFDNESFLDDIANYKDLVHHSEPYNQQIFKLVSEGKNELTPSNIEDYISQITALANHYDLHADARYFKEQLGDRLK